MHVRIATKNSSKTKFQAKLHNFFFLLWPHSTHFHSHFIIPSIHTSQESAHNQSWAVLEIHQRLGGIESLACNWGLVDWTGEFGRDGSSRRRRRKVETVRRYQFAIFESCHLILQVCTWQTNRSVMSSNLDGKEIEPICNSQVGMWEMGLRLEQSILGLSGCSGWFTPDL